MQTDSMGYGTVSNLDSYPDDENYMAIQSLNSDSSTIRLSVAEYFYQCLSVGNNDKNQSYFWYKLK